MRIQHPQTNASQQASKAQAPEAKKHQAKSAPHSKGAEGSSMAEISLKAKEMAQARSVAEGAPEVREERIAELRKRIQNHDYSVDPEAIADRMLREHSEL